MATRTGLRTLYELARRLCAIIAKFTPIMLSIIPPDKHVYLHALNQACVDFTTNVNVPQLLGDEDA